MMQLGKYHKVPFITGCCSREGMFLYAVCTTGRKNHLLRDDTIVPFNLNARQGTTKYDAAKSEIMEFYFGNRDPLKHKDDIYRVIIKNLQLYDTINNDSHFKLQLYSDNYFLYEVYRTAKTHVLTSTTPVYFYNFAHSTDLNLMKNLYNFTEKGKTFCIEKFDIFT